MTVALPPKQGTKEHSEYIMELYYWDQSHRAPVHTQTLKTFLSLSRAAEADLVVPFEWYMNCCEALFPYERFCRPGETRSNIKIRGHIIIAREDA